MDNNFEKVVLSSIFFNPNLIEDAIKILVPQDFYIPMHQSIYEEMINLYRDQLPIDEDFIKQKLRNLNENILLEIISTNSVTSIKHYANEIKDSSIKRKLQSVINKANIMLNNNESDEYNYLQILSELDKNLEIIKNKDINFNNFLEIESIEDIEEKDTTYIGVNYLPFPEYSVSMIAGPGGIGKTWLIINSSIKLIDEDNTRKILAIVSEDNKGKIKSRFNKIEKRDTKYKNIHISDIMPFDALERDFKRGVWKETEDFFKFKEVAKKYDIVFMDPLVSFFSGDENSNADAKKFMVHFINFCKREKVTLIFLHHTDKGGYKSRGAGAFSDATRLTYKVDKNRNDKNEIIEDNKLYFTVQKENDNLKAIKDLDKNNGFLLKVFPSTPIIVEYKENIKKDIPSNNKEDNDNTRLFLEILGEGLD